MNAKIKKLLRLVGDATVRNFRDYPFEHIAALLFGFLSSFKIGDRSWEMAFILSVLAIWFVHNLSDTLQKRALYWGLSPVVIGLLAIFNWQLYFESRPESLFTTSLLLISASFLSFWHNPPKTLEQRIVDFINALSTTYLLSGISMLLLMGFTYSISALFGFELTPLFQYQIPQFIATTLLLLQLFIWQYTEASSSPFVEAYRQIGKWIGVPLLLLYTVVLYLFFIRLLFIQEAPENVIEGIVVGFALFSIYYSLMGMSELNAIYRNFFRYLHWILIFPFLMLVTVIYEQITTHGLTTNYYLLALFAVTLFVYISLSFVRNIHKFRLILSTAALLMLIANFAPQINMYDTVGRGKILLKGGSLLGNSEKSYWYNYRELHPVQIGAYSEWVPASSQEFAQYGSFNAESQRYQYMHALPNEEIAVGELLQARLNNIGLEKLQDNEALPDSLFLLEGKQLTLIVQSFHVVITDTKQIKVKEVSLRGLLLK